MPVSVCPHCKTQLWVKDSQLNIAQGFVACSKCEGLFQAKDHLRGTPENIQPGQLPPAVSDTKLIHRLGTRVRGRKTLSKQEIADLLDNVLPADAKAKAAAATGQPKPATNWTLATLVALTVLIMQLFYLMLLR